MSKFRQNLPSYQYNNGNLNKMNNSDFVTNPQKCSGTSSDSNSSVNTAGLNYGSKSGFSKHNNPSQNQQNQVKSRNRKSQKQDISIPLTIGGADASLQGPRNKRGEISMNHLLNFSFPARQPPSASPLARLRKKTVHYEPFNKERFVNANFRFVMDPDFDYSIHLADPDVVVDWDNIIQVLEVSMKPPKCPICLSPPVAAKITKCGHVYCYPCILHYLSLSEGKSKWRECPICQEMMCAKDLKSIVGLETTQHINEKQIEFRLMKRDLNSTVVLPRDSYDTWVSSNGVVVKDSVLPPSVENVNAFLFTKLMVSTSRYRLNEILNVEKHSLETLIEDNKAEKTNFGISHDESDLVFAQMALLEVNTRITGEVAKIPEFVPKQPPTKPKSSPVAIKISALDIPQEVAVSGDPWENDELAVKIAPPIESASPVSESNVPKKADAFYFYQAADGQHIYLHPLDVRILKNEFSDYSNFPDSINVKILASQESTVTEDLRKRCKYLSHLPISCDVSFCEVDLNGIVKKETLKTFEKELKLRIQRIKEKQRKEKQVKHDTQPMFIPSMSPISFPPSEFVAKSFEDEFPLAIPSVHEDGLSSRDELTEHQELLSVAPFSFAKVASSESKGQQPVKKYDDGVDEYIGWTLDLEDSLDGFGSGGGGMSVKKSDKKKKGKKMLVVSNGGARGRI